MIILRLGISYYLQYYFGVLGGRSSSSVLILTIVLLKLTIATIYQFNTYKKNITI